MGGYSLWFAIVFGVAWTVAASKLKARRQTKFDATLGTLPVTYGPPALTTKGDHFIASITAPLLRPGEAVQHQAYTLLWDFAGERASAEQATFVVLTTQRVLVFRTRVGAFGILYENNGTSHGPWSTTASWSSHSPTGRCVVTSSRARPRCRTRPRS